MLTYVGDINVLVTRYTNFLGARYGKFLWLWMQESDEIGIFGKYMNIAIVV